MKECRGEEDNGFLGGLLLRLYRGLANRVQGEVRDLRSKISS